MGRAHLLPIANVAAPADPHPTYEGEDEYEGENKDDGEVYKNLVTHALTFIMLGHLHVHWYVMMIM
jgi:hypothetical protein